MIDNGGAFDTFIKDLFKAFDCSHHRLSIAKLDTYGFDIKLVNLILVNLIQQYLSNTKQKIKVGNVFMKQFLERNVLW